MSNIEVREDGYYLCRHFEGGGLSIETVTNNELYIGGEYYSFEDIHIHWIADEPLDLEWLADPRGEAARCVSVH